MVDIGLGHVARLLCQVSDMQLAWRAAQNALRPPASGGEEEVHNEIDGCPTATGGVYCALVMDHCHGEVPR
jgi:hypothetical protein